MKVIQFKISKIIIIKNLKLFSDTYTTFKPYRSFMELNAFHKNLAIELCYSFKYYCVKKGFLLQN